MQIIHRFSFKTSFTLVSSYVLTLALPKAGYAGVLLILSVFFFACGGSDQGQKGTQYQRGKEGRAYGGVYTFNSTESVTNFDPVQLTDFNAVNIANQVFELLVDLDPKTQQIVPELAVSWEVMDGGTSYIFHLRDGVYFHEDNSFPQGVVRKLTAEDVKFSLERVCNPRTQTAGDFLFRDIVIGASEYYDEQKRALDEGRDPRITEIKGIEVLDSRRVRFRLTKPYGPFLYSLTSPFCYILPKEAVLFYGDRFKEHPVGTGPFQIFSFNPEKGVVLKRNPTYWDKDEYGNSLPFLDEIRVTYFPDRAYQQNELKKGTLSESFGIPREFRSEWLDETASRLHPQFQREFQYQATPGLATEFLGFNVAKAPFTDLRVRRAFSHAINRDRIEALDLRNEGFAANYGLIPPTMPNYKSGFIKGIKFDPEKAKKLLKEAGYPNGVGFPKISLCIPSNHSRAYRIARSVQGMLKEHLSVTIEIHQMAWKELNDAVDFGQCDFFRQEWVADYAEPQNFLNLFYGKFVPTSTTEKSFPNQFRYVNPKFDQLFEKALVTVDDSVRYKLYLQAEQYAMDDAPLIPLNYTKEERIMHIDIRDNPISSMGRFDLKRVWFDRVENSSKRKAFEKTPGKSGFNG